MSSPHKPWLLAVMSLVAALLIVAPFLFWHQTWFGRPLSDSDIAQYLNDAQHPRRAQHALTQISERMARSDAATRQWYPRIVELSRHHLPEIRLTAAWVMGQDNTSGAFHEALLPLLHDADVMVRRNAALSLVRFADGRSRGELVNTLRPLTITSPSAGNLSLQVQPGQSVGHGTLLARLAERERDIEIRSPYATRVESILAADGSRVEAGERVLSISPEPGQAWEALRALYLVGQLEDLEEVTRFGDGLVEDSSRVRQQAAVTAQAIRARSAQTPNR